MTKAKLEVIAPQPDPDVVEILEEALEMAKRGELRSVMVTGEITGNHTYTHYATGDLLTAIGLASFLTHTLQAAKSRLAE